MSIPAAFPASCTKVTRPVAASLSPRIALRRASLRSGSEFRSYPTAAWFPSGGSI